MITVTLLGTGGSAGVPMIGGADGAGDWGVCDPGEPKNRRTRSAIHIAGPEGCLLVDTGPELRAQLLSCRISRVDAIFYTHAHADHITGLDDVRILNRIADRPLPAYGTEETLRDIETRFPYAFRPWTPPGFYRPVLVGEEVAAGEKVRLAGLPLLLIDQNHGFTRSLGLRLGDFAYCTDVFDFEPEGFAALEGLDTWVVGCFQRGAHRTHAPLDKVLGWVERLRPRRTILTHMGPDMDYNALRGRLPAGVEPGFDGMAFSFDNVTK